LIKKTVILVQFIVLIKDFSFHLVNFISNNLLPPEANVFAHSQVAGRGPKKDIHAPTYSTGQKNVTPIESL